MRAFVTITCLWLVAVVAVGCSKESREGLTASLKQGADSVSQKAQEVTAAASGAAEQATAALDAGEMKIQLDASEPITAAGCYAEWLTFEDGRPSVLQLASYSQSDRETFPSLFVRAVVPTADGEPFGKTVKARVFVQTAADAPIFFTADTEPADLAIGSNGETITATLSGGMLHRSDGGSSIPAQGSFVFSLR